jgi:malonate-semialdehyde dehydrogenase (acetylating)/methylmalonate-semialdehyde dehydrogenase
VKNPATGEVIAKAPLSGASEVEKAVAAASKAWQTWRRVPPGDRIQPLFKLKALMDAQVKDLARTITEECGKTLVEAEAEVKRAIENVEVASGIPSLMQGSNLEDIAPGSRSASSASSRRSTSPAWCRCGSCRTPSPAATRW